MLPVAEYLHGLDDFRVTALIGWQGESSKEAISHCKKIGMEVLLVPTSLSFGDHMANETPKDNILAQGDKKTTTPSWVKNLKSFRKKISNILKYFPSVKELIFGAKEYLRCLHNKNYAASLLDLYQFDIAFLGPYLGFNYDIALVFECYKRNIPSAVLPVFAHVSKAITAKRRYHIDSYCTNRSLLAKVLAKFQPNYIYKENGREYFVFEPGRLIAAKLAGLMPLDPCMTAAGPVTKFIVDNKWLYDRYIEDGISKDRLIIAGKPSLDQVFREISNPNFKKNVYETLNLDEDREFLLFSVEPLAEHLVLPWDKHLKILKNVIERLVELNLPVVVSLHPLCDPAKYTFLINDYKCVMPENLKFLSLLPFCKIFIVSAYSSTLFSALSIGKPCVAYDFRGNSNEDGFLQYDSKTVLGNINMEGFYLVKDLENLSIKLNTHCSSFNSNGKEDKSNSGYFDGNVSQRIANFTKEIVGKSKNIS